MTAPYALVVTPAAHRDLTALKRSPPDKALLHRIDGAISGLAANPRPQGTLKLQGSEVWRIVVGDYRILYVVDDEHRLVTIARVGHRREVYRD